MRRVRWWVLAGLLFAGLALLGALPALGLERLPVAASLLPARNAWTAGAAALGVALLVAGAFRRVRRAAVPLGLALVLGAATSAPVVLQRGVVDDAAAAPGPGTLRVLSWNVNGDLVGPEVIAGLAVRERADVVVLPESSTPVTPVSGDRLVGAFAAAGIPVVELPLGQAGTTTTLVLARTALGPWSLAGDRSPEADRSAVVSSTRPGLPRIVAIHAVVPTPRSTPVWSADLDWAARQCADPDTVVVGDFNTSLDGFGGGLGSTGLGGCTDAALQVGAASVGSWPTGVPTWLGMPIDHVLTGRDWRARSYTVLTGEDGSGARHRPVLAVLAHR